MLRFVNGFDYFLSDHRDVVEPEPYDVVFEQDKLVLRSYPAPEPEELGLLPPIQARAQGGFMDTTIVPFVHLLTEQPPTAPGPEATETFWLPLAQVRSGELDGRFPHVRADGGTVQLPCWDFEGRRIWGLTFRIVTELMHPKD